MLNEPSRELDATFDRYQTRITVLGVPSSPLPQACAHEFVLDETDGTQFRCQWCGFKFPIHKMVFAARRF